MPSHSTIHDELECAPPTQACTQQQQHKYKGELEDTFKAASRRGNHLQEGKWGIFRG